MSERNPRKRKRATESENTLSVKRKKTRAAAAGRLPRPSSPYQRQQEHICPYNLRSHAHLHATEVTSKVGNSSQASTSEGKGMDWGAERCTICLSTFGRQLVGTPASCAHSFCLKCLQKWAKESNTCPVGRQKFTQICVRKQVRGRVLRKVEVKSPREVMVGFQAPHFTPVHELQISIHQRVDARRPHNEVSAHLPALPPATVCPVCLQPRSN